ncbi:hypothetical protein V2J09_012397 [Rumex salicifolius]
MEEVLRSGVVIIVVGVAVALALSTLPTILQPPTLPGSHNHLVAAQIIPVPGAFGPESLAFDPNGDGPYTGVADGRILKWIPQDRLRFDKRSGNLYIADAYFGLYVVGPEGGLASPLITQLEGRPFYFTNDLDIDEEEGVIYFTDSSTLYHRRNFPLSSLSGDETGRLLKYNISSKEATILARDLAFANGVALSKDRAFLVVAESRESRVLRYWLEGPKAGTYETLLDLPGYPDNIRRNAKGEFWIALHAKKGMVAGWILSTRAVGRMLMRLPLSLKQLHSVLVSGKPHATAVRVSEEGKVLEIIEDVEGVNLRFISEVEEKDGKLWIGSVMTSFIGVFDLPPQI